MKPGTDYQKTKQMQTRHHPDKKETQTDRIVFFSDAVFAIAITLLVIELKVPKIEGAITDHNFLIALGEELPKISGFILSFFIIGLYWSVHHNIFGFVINYTTKLIWLNLIFLFTIALMPFSTAVYSEYSFSDKYIDLLAPFSVYAVNIIMIGIMNFWLNSYIFSSKNNVAEGYTDIYVKFAKIRSLTLPLIFVLALLTGLINVNLGKSSLLLIPVVMIILRRVQKAQIKKSMLEDEL